MSHRIEQILTQEGLEIFRPKSLLGIPIDCQKAAIDLFRFLPELPDPRWSIALSWTRARQLGIRPIHEEVSQSAIYLSLKPGYRNGYSSFQSEPNLRLIARASVNLASLDQVKRRYCQSNSIRRTSDIQHVLAITNKITRGTNPDGTTGCPEALYQIRMQRNKDYLGRAGFNIHTENGAQVVSISNIQGIPGGRDIYAQLEKKEGVNPFVSLVSFVRSMFPDAVIRGVKNPVKNPEFYNTVLSRAGVTRMNRVTR